MVAHRSEVRGTRAARGRDFRDDNCGQEETCRDTERKEKHRYFPFYAERVSEAVAVIGRTFGVCTGRIGGRGWSGVESASHFSELGGWCRPGTSGKDLKHIRIRPFPLLFRFLNAQDLIDGDVFQNLPQAARPEDFDPLNCCGLAQAEMKADIVAAEITGDVVDLFDLLFV